MTDALPATLPETRQKVGLFDRLARRAVVGQLAGLRRGKITLKDDGAVIGLGETADLHTGIQVHHPRFFRETALGGSMSVAETYLRGDWDCDDLTSLFRIFIRNLNHATQLDRGSARLVGFGHQIYHWLRSNTRKGSRRNIAEHYDLGNDFFQLWLDDTMAYSSGIFRTPEAGLQDASVEKFDRVCRKLALRRSDHLVEIGTGWGGLAIHAASHYGCRVTTTTISAEQFKIARDRVADAGLSDRVTLLQQDYRDLNGQFDKLASIEMIEAVGHKYLDDYFRKCGELLRPEGSMVIQAITMPESRYREYLNSVDFIRRYIFPGGCLPSTARMLESVGRSTDMRFVHAEDLAPHYAETLRRWRHRFHQRLEEVRQLGYSERFIRMWNYYLCISEAVFEERHIGIVQLQFDKAQCRRDPIGLSAQAAADQRQIPFHGQAAVETRPLACLK